MTTDRLAVVEPDRDVVGVLTAACEKFGVLGAAVALRAGGQERSCAVGLRDRTGDGRVTSKSRFRLGSIAKVVTAAALEAELDRAAMALDDPVSSVIAEFAPTPALAPISFRHLLMHTSGIDGTLWQGFGDGDDAIARYAAASSDLGSLFEPGTSWAYSNTGLVLAGRAIETLSGLDFTTAVGRSVIEPSGCQQVSLYEPTPPPGAANGHYASGDSIRPAEIPRGERALAPAGAPAFATASDILRLARHLLSPAHTERLASEAIHLPPSERDAATHQTLGWRMHRWGDLDCFGHDGGSTGQASFLRVVPGADAAIAFVANTVPNAMFAWSTVSRWFFDRIGLEIPGPIRASEGAHVDPADVGVYRCRDATFTISREADQTHRISFSAFDGQSSATAELQALGPNLYRAIVPLVDAHGVVSIEHAADGSQLLHAGPFTARRAD